VERCAAARAIAPRAIKLCTREQRDHGPTCVMHMYVDSKLTGWQHQHLQSAPAPVGTSPCITDGAFQSGQVLCLVLFRAKLGDACVKPARHRSTSPLAPRMCFARLRGSATFYHDARRVPLELSRPQSAAESFSQSEVFLFALQSISNT